MKKEEYTTEIPEQPGAYDRLWLDTYREAKDFYMRTGHYPKYTEDKKLYAWGLRSWRSSRKLWRHNPSQRWKENYACASRHYRRTGHFPRPDENRRIYNWAYAWVRDNGKDDPARMRMLQDIGYGISKFSDIWERNYKELKKYCTQTGHCPDKKGNDRLYTWAYNWMEKFGKKHPERMEKLRQLGLDTPRKWNIWERNYELAKKIYEETGRFPTNSRANGNHVRLAMWAHNWERRLGEKYPERLAMLRAIGYGQANTWENWDRNYAAAKEIYERTGKFPAWNVNQTLYSWAYAWDRKHGAKYPERKAMLFAIGYKESPRKKKN